jgi:phosphatidylserine decarboxylase
MKQRSRDGILVEGADGQDRLLAALYGNTFGRMLLKPLTAPGLSKLAGKFLSTKASKVFIKPFIRNNHIDMSQFEPVEYESYNDFFSRRIRPEARPIDMDPGHLISPADSKLTALPITESGRFILKHTEYTVGSLLKDPALAAEYVGGWALIFRLTVDDYHRYCYAFSGEKGENISIPGKLHTVNPIANDFFPIYKENAREYTIVRTEGFGEVIAMEVGALLVGRIVNHQGAASVKRGQEKGYFQFGGSTVVLLLKKDTAVIDGDILENSRNGIETVVKFGEKIGIAM